MYFYNFRMAASAFVALLLHAHDVQAHNDHAHNVHARNVHARNVHTHNIHARNVSANIKIHNWCPFNIYAYQETINDCARGGPPDYPCYVYQHAEYPFVIPTNTVATFPRVDLPSANIKMSKVKDLEHGIFQFEYTVNNALALINWDISDLDGTTDGVVGNIFAGYNVKATPTGDLGAGPCHQMKCPKESPVCTAAFQHPDDNFDILGCPVDTGDFWVDLCEPDESF